MKYEIAKIEFEYTGGGIWVLFSEIQLPNKKRTIYASTSEEFTAFYDNKDDSLWCENQFEMVWFDEIKTAKEPYKSISKELFARFDCLREIHRYD